MRKKKVVILYTRGGQGLLSGAIGIKEALLRESEGQYLEIEIIDFFSQCRSIGRPLTAIYNFFLRRSLRLNSLYLNFIHWLRSDRWPFLYLKLTPQFDRLIEQVKPDLIITTSQYIVSFLGYYKKLRHLTRPIIVANIDPGSDCLPLWFDNRLDQHLIPTPECQIAFSNTLGKLGSGKSVQVKFCVREQFLQVQKKDVEKVRKKLKIPASHFMVLFSGSREGYEGITKIISELLTLPLLIVIFCGENRNLFNKLKAMSTVFPQLRPLQWVDNVAEYMISADLVVAKSGKQTLKESLISGTPLIPICWPTVMPQEEGNIEFLRNREILLKGTHPRKIKKIVTQFLYNQKYYLTFQKKWEAIGREVVDPRLVAQQILHKISG